MFKKLLVVLSLLFIPTAALASTDSVGGYATTVGCSGVSSPCFVQNFTAKPLGYQQFTVATATALPSVPTNATYALIVCETQSVRWRDDGTNPTASVGFLLPASTLFTYTGTLSTLKIIETTASATCNVSYYR